MQRGLINHFDLTVSDLDRSIRFYDALLTYLGYVRSTEYEGGIPNWTLRVGPICLSLGLHKARVDTVHNRYSPGLHHLAFHASSREDVQSVYALVKSMGEQILDAPAEYDYTPGYFAAFFADPDGLKVEVVFEPRLATAGA